MLAIVSPSIRTSAAYEPSAVTIVPLVMSVRIGPSWRNPRHPAAMAVRRVMVGDGEGGAAAARRARRSVAGSSAGRRSRRRRSIDAGLQRRDSSVSGPRAHRDAGVDGRGRRRTGLVRRWTWRAASAVGPPRGAGGAPGAGRRGVPRRRVAPGSAGAAASGGARANGGSSPTMALGWMLAVLVAIAGSVELERPHVPRRARHLAGAVALTATATGSRTPTGQGGRPRPSPRPHPST